MTRRLIAAAVAAATAGAALASAGCSGAPRPTTLTVFAASSLTGSFEELGRSFEAQHPGVAVRFSFEGSSGLVDQLAAGAPADVLATADETTMARAETQHLVRSPTTVFATNTLVLVTAPGNPGKVTGLDDSLRDRRLVICAPQVPCGRASQDLAALSGITLHPVSEESTVTDVLGKVAAGEADAGLVYRTDARAAPQVGVIEPPHAGEVINRYPVAVTRDAPEPDLAREFVALVSSAEARQVLTAAGFGAP